MRNTYPAAASGKPGADGSHARQSYAKGTGADEPHERIKASEEIIAKSLVGDYRPEHLFTLRQSLSAYRNYQQMIEECEREIRRALEQFHPANFPQTSDPELPPPSSPTKPGSGRRSADGVSRAELKQAIGIDLNQIPGIHTGIAQTLFGEIGPTSPNSAVLPHSLPGWPMPGQRD